MPTVFVVTFQFIIWICDEKLATDTFGTKEEFDQAQLNLEWLWKISLEKNLFAHLAKICSYSILAIDERNQVNFIFIPMFWANNKGYSWWLIELHFTFAILKDRDFFHKKERIIHYLSFISLSQSTGPEWSNFQLLLIFSSSEVIV